MTSQVARIRSRSQTRGHILSNRSLLAVSTKIQAIGMQYMCHIEYHTLTAICRPSFDQIVDELEGL
jgi:hypothetical protein